MKKENAQQGAQSVSVSGNEYSTIQPIADTEMTMSSREIAELTGKQHAHIMRDVRNMLDELEEEQNPFLDFDYSGANGRRLEFFRLDREHVECLLTGYSAILRMRVIKRWKELEKTSQLQLPRTRTEAIEMMLEQSRMLDRQQVYIEETKHYVEFAQVVSSSKEGKKLEEFAKVVGIGRNKLFAYLREAKILQTDNVRERSDTHNIPYQRYLDAKNFIVSRKAYQRSSGRHRGHTTLITGKGEVWLTKKLIQDGIIDNAVNNTPALPHQQ